MVSVDARRVGKQSQKPRPPTSRTGHPKSTRETDVRGTQIRFRIYRPGHPPFAVLPLRHDTPPRSAESYTLPCGLRGAGQLHISCRHNSYYSQAKERRESGEDKREFAEQLKRDWEGFERRRKP